ncbi:nitroreductase family protein [Leucobacter salsicius]|uniref:nitroreductase family protein n=1 Tax=Leucobacter salsicius TaxID=664638 RepID=UPI000344B302|nr:nitroreductase family protein [Leucobacter salsicius]
MTTALEALELRRSHSKLVDPAPSPEQLAPLVAAMTSVADHSGLRPWRLIEMRGDARTILGEALADAAEKPDKREKLIKKAERAPLVLAVVVSPRKSDKVPLWEQEAVASGVAHLLSLLLDEAGWGVIWRTGSHTRSAAVHRAHQLGEHEYLLGWLYIGSVPDQDRRAKPRKPLDLPKHLSAL